MIPYMGTVNPLIQALARCAETVGHPAEWVASMQKFRDQGYTLLQLAAVMALICVLAATGLPAFQELLERQRTAATIHRLSTQLALARNSAISSRGAVSACPSSGDGGCRDDSDWSQGWIVYRDPDRQGQPANASRILSQERLPATGAMTLLSSRGRRAIRFLPDGRSAGSNITVRICSRGHLLAEVVVNNVGRVRSAKPSGRPPCTAPE
jgi:type IV fimbrial biogenesis protein FimT